MMSSMTASGTPTALPGRAGESRAQRPARHGGQARRVRCEPPGH
jgi:hypothetical protein